MEQIYGNTYYYIGDKLLYAVRWRKECFSMDGRYGDEVIDDVISAILSASE